MMKINQKIISLSIFPVFLSLSISAIASGFIDVEKFSEKQTTSDCFYCVENFLFDTYSCTTCDIEDADCYKLIIASTYACCTDVEKPTLCENIYYNPSAPNAVYFAWALPNQPCRPVDLCSDCPTGYCIHAPQPNLGEECLPTGEAQYENGATYCGS